MLSRDAASRGEACLCMGEELMGKTPEPLNKYRRQELRVGVDEADGSIAGDLCGVLFFLEKRFQNYPLPGVGDCAGFEDLVEEFY